MTATPRRRFADEVGARLAAVGLALGDFEIDMRLFEEDDETWIASTGDVVWIERVLSARPREGLGRLGMAAACMLADELGMRLALRAAAHPDVPGALRQDELDAFYASLGFRPRRDRVLVRDPHAETVVHVIRDVAYQPKPNRSEIVLSRIRPPADLTATSFSFPIGADGSVLMASSLRPGRGVEPAGGHVEPGETIEDAAVREAGEEVFAAIADVRPIGFQRMTSAGTRPEGWRYPFPLAFQAFSTARIAERRPWEPNDECGPPVEVSDPTGLPVHLRLLAMRARTEMER